jgi:plasmid stabilization system protein ParE
MPRGDKSKYTDKQERKADHIAESYEERGLSEKEAERRAWATVNKDEAAGRNPEAPAAARKPAIRRRTRAGSSAARPRRPARRPLVRPLHGRLPPRASAMLLDLLEASPCRKPRSLNAAFVEHHLFPSVDQAVSDRVHNGPAPFRRRPTTNESTRS